MTKPPINTLGTESPMSFPGTQHITCVVTDPCWGNCVLCDSAGKELLENFTSFPPNFTHVLFLFADYALYPFSVNKS